MANSADYDQMQHSVASDLGLHCLLKPVCPIFRVIMIPFIFGQTGLNNSVDPYQMMLQNGVSDQIV